MTTKVKGFMGHYTRLHSTALGGTAIIAALLRISFWTGQYPIRRSYVKGNEDTNTAREVDFLRALRLS